MPDGPIDGVKTGAVGRRVRSGHWPEACSFCLDSIECLDGPVRSGAFRSWSYSILSVSSQQSNGKCLLSKTTFGPVDQVTIVFGKLAAGSVVADANIVVCSRHLLRTAETKGPAGNRLSVMHKGHATETRILDRKAAGMRLSMRTTCSIGTPVQLGRPLATLRSPQHQSTLASWLSQAFSLKTW